ncbi:MAG: 16S rRNA (guanine(966)-N(2))-methyltransferase RsmD [Actinomycetota bacterium]
MGLTPRRNRHTGAMRVVSGEFGGRKFATPEGVETRPTSERIREAMFNSLYSIDAIDDARVLDAFAGSGGLGIEALSRGAAHATFVESGPAALAVIRDNLAALDLGRVSAVVPGDALTHLARGDHYDLVLLDPPYGFDQWDELLARVPAGAVVVIESDREVGVPDSWEVHRLKRYGSTVVTLATAGMQGEAQ